eukprot:jgi/Picsp_1/2220/NSC_05684-R1_rna binding protein
MPTTDASAGVEGEDAVLNAKIKKQIEFYFSDSNLYRDSFLREQIGLAQDGYIDIRLLCIFNRMRQLLLGDSFKPNQGPNAPDQVEDSMVQRVAAAVKDSSVVQVSTDGKSIKRLPPMNKDPAELTADIDDRSLLVSPFRFDIKLEELTGFFDSVIGDVNAVRMRRHVSSKDFRGSVFVEFATKEKSEKVLEDSNSENGFSFDGARLKMEPKLEFVKRKQEERHAKKNSPYNPAAPKTENGANACKPVKITVDDKEIEEFNMSAGSCVKFDFGSVTFNDPVTFGLVKDSFGGKGSGLKFVDYEPGDTTGYARFETPLDAKNIVEQSENGKRMLAGYEATLTVLQGDHEREYIKKVIAIRKKAASQRQSENSKFKKRKFGDHRGRGRGRGRGGRRGGKRPRSS